LKRRNCSPNTVKNYLNIIKHFVIWLDIPVEEVTHATVSRYIDVLMGKRLAPKTVNCHVDGIRQFYHYLREEEGMAITNPVRKSHTQKMSRPLPRYLRDEQVELFFNAVKGQRDRAMFMLMLRCGLRVEEVANLTMGVIDVKRRTVLIEDGKGAKDRVVYMSNDALQALISYLRVRPSSRTRKIFLVKKSLSMVKKKLAIISKIFLMLLKDSIGIKMAKKSSVKKVIVGVVSIARVTNSPILT